MVGVESVELIQLLLAYALIAVRRQYQQVDGRLVLRSQVAVLGEIGNKAMKPVKYHNESRLIGVDVGGDGGVSRPPRPLRARSKIRAAQYWMAPP